MQGGIINVASAAGFAAAPLMGPYNVGKAAVMSPVGNDGGGILGYRCAGVGSVSHVRQDQRRRRRPDHREFVPAGRVCDALDRTSPDKIAARTLDAFDRGRLYVVPQFDAKAVWRFKRLLPAVYVRFLGLLNRVLPAEQQPAKNESLTSTTTGA